MESRVLLLFKKTLGLTVYGAGLGFSIQFSLMVGLSSASPDTGFKFSFP